MPMCFSLSRKSNPDSAVALSEIDNEMCRFFGIEPHPVNWLANWYNYHGIDYACGVSLTEVRKMEEDDTDSMDYQVAKYLEDHYVLRQWREIGRSN